MRKVYPPSLLKTVVEFYGGQVALAARYQRAGFMTVRQQTILKWLDRGGIPAEWGEATELATDGRITALEVFRACQRRPEAGKRKRPALRKRAA